MDLKEKQSQAVVLTLLILALGSGMAIPERTMKPEETGSKESLREAFNLRIRGDRIVYFF